MRLTKFDKSAFVRAVMGDVPNIDYDTPAQNIVIAHLKSIVPAEVQAVIAKYPGWVPNNCLGMPGVLSNFCTPLGAGYGYREVCEMPEIREQLAELSRCKADQVKARRALEDNTAATISQFGTLKAARTALPEFAKYLPKERDGVVDRSMPVVVNLVTELMAAGWPKDGESTTVSPNPTGN